MLIATHNYTYIVGDSFVVLLYSLTHNSINPTREIFSKSQTYNTYGSVEHFSCV